MINMTIDPIDVLERYLRILRNSNKHHLGLGDVRLTISQQEQILKFISQRIEQ